MQFDHPLIEGRLVKRYKRFLADVELPDGKIICVHCPNPGSMMGLKEPGSRVWLSDSRNPKRKLQYTLELMKVGQTLVGINTNLPNKLVEEALQNNVLSEILPFSSFQREVRYGENSRIDFLLDADSERPTWLEVKNVHLLRQPGLHEFPDSVTSRGAKHLKELIKQVQMGHRAVMLFVVQREDGDRFRIARDIDPAYAKAFDEAMENGVEALCIRCKITLNNIIACKLIEIDEKTVDNPQQML